MVNLAYDDHVMTIYVREPDYENLRTMFTVRLRNGTFLPDPNVFKVDERGVAEVELKNGSVVRGRAEVVDVDANDLLPGEKMNGG